MRIQPVDSPAKLDAILALQRENLRGVVDEAEAAREGFVTVAHTREILERMHAVAPSVIALEGAALAGYALVMPLQARAWLPILDPMFALFDALSFRGRPLASQRFYVMGQVCVAKAFRGRGVFDALYAGHRALLADRFDIVVTEIATRNVRSMRAHARVGFEVVHTHRDEIDDWAVVACALADLATAR